MHSDPQRILLAVDGCLLEASPQAMWRKPSEQQGPQQLTSQVVFVDLMALQRTLKSFRPSFRLCVKPKRWLLEEACVATLGCQACMPKSNCERRPCARHKTEVCATMA